MLLCYFQRPNPENSKEFVKICEICEEKNNQIINKKRNEILR